MPDRKYKTPNGQIVSKKELQDKYGERLNTLIQEKTFVEVNENVYKAPNGKLELESVLKNKYGDQFNELVSKNTFVLETPLKKKEDSGSTAPNQELVSEQQDGSLATQQTPTIQLTNQEAGRQKQRIPVESLDTTSPDLPRQQRLGVAPPNSEISRQTRPQGLTTETLDQYMSMDWGQAQTSFQTDLAKETGEIERLQRRTTGRQEKPTSEAEEKINHLSFLLNEPTLRESSDFRKSLEDEVRVKDLELDLPHKYYSEFESGDDVSNSFIESHFGSEYLKGIGIDPVDFDGYLNKNGYRSQFEKNLEQGVVSESGETKKTARTLLTLIGLPMPLIPENDTKLSYEMEKFNMLMGYVSEMDNRANRREQLALEYEQGKPIKSSTLPFTTFDREAIKNYIETELPLFNQVIQDVEKKNKEIYQKHLDGDTGFWYGTGKFVTELGKGFSDRVQDMSITAVGLVSPTTAKQGRYARLEQELKTPNQRTYSFASGREVEHDGRVYLVNEDGNIYDTELKINATDLFLDPQPLYDKAEKSTKQRNSFSTLGLAMETGNVLGDLSVQILTTRGFALASGATTRGGLMVSSMGAQSAMGFSRGLEDTWRLAKQAGLTDDQAKELANTIAPQTAAWYGVTALISPQVKAQEAIFGGTKDQVLKRAINRYANEGVRGVQEELKRYGKEVSRRVLLVAEEGLAKEAPQEIIQQSGELFGINPQINQAIGDDVLPTEWTSDNLKSVLAISTMAGGIPAQFNFNSSSIDRLSAIQAFIGDKRPIQNITAPLVIEGVLTTEQAQEIKNDVEAYQKFSERIPKNLSQETVLSMVNTFRIIDILENQKSNLEPVFHGELDQEISSLRNKVENLITLSNLGDKKIIELKDQAQRELVQEAGEQDIQLNDAQITERAIEIFNRQDSQKTDATQSQDPDVESLNNRLDELKQEESAKFIEINNNKNLTIEERQQEIKKVSDDTFGKMMELRSQNEVLYDIVEAEREIKFYEDNAAFWENRAKELENPTFMERLLGRNTSIGDNTVEQAQGAALAARERVNELKEELNNLKNVQTQATETVQDQETQPETPIQEEVGEVVPNDRFVKVVENADNQEVTEVEKRLIEKIIDRGIENGLTAEQIYGNILSRGFSNPASVAPESNKAYIQSRIDADQQTKTDETTTTPETQVTPTTETTVSDATTEFASELGGFQEDVSEFVQGATKVTIGSTEVILNEKEGNIAIESIRTPRSERGQGSARTAINKVVEVADNQGKTLQLNVAAAETGINADQLVKFYESVGFVKSENFDPDGGLMTRPPQDPFAAIDQVISETTPVTQTEVETDTRPVVGQPITIETNSNEYTVQPENGELKITPRFGNAQISATERRNITRQYLEQTNFDTGTQVQADGNLSNEQVNDLVAQESTNPQEVARTIQQVQEQDQTQEQELTPQDAIAEALLESRVIDSNNDITDMSAAYRLGQNKIPRTIDEIRELAETKLGQDVTFQDVLDFIDTHNSSTDYYNKTGRTDVNNTLTDLEAKFTELTGLRPTPNNVNRVANTDTTQEQTTDESIDDVPFQTESNQVKINREQLRQLIDRLEQTGLAEKVVLLNNSQTENRLNEIGRQFTETPLGFVDGDTVYLNTDKVTKDTAIHEFSHLFLSNVKQNHKSAYDRGIELIRDSEYFTAIENNPAYDNLTEQQKLEESLAQAIGEKGVKILNESKKATFSNWFKNLFKKIANGLGLTKLTGNQLANLTLETYTDLVAAELLSKRPIKTRTQEGRRVDTSGVTNIEVAIESQEAAFDARQKAMTVVNNKNSVEADVKKELRNYINKAINKDNLNEADKRDVNALINAVAKAKTFPNFKKALSDIDRIVERLNERLQETQSEQARARFIAKKRLQNERTKNKFKKQAVRDYLKSAIDKKWLENTTFADVNRINNAINAATDRSLQDAIEMIDKLAIHFETRYDERQARNEEKRRIADQKIKDKKATVDETRKAVRDYINDSFDNKLLGRMGLQEFKNLINKTKTQTKKQLVNTLAEIDNIVLNIQNKILRSKIDDALTSSLSRMQSGKEVAGAVSQEAKVMLDAISNIISDIPKSKIVDGERKTLTKAEKQQVIREKIEQVQDDILNITHEESTDINGEPVLIPRQNLSDAQLETLNVFNIAETVLKAELSEDVLTTNVLLDKALGEILFIRDNGKTALLAEKEVQARKLDEELANSIEDVDALNTLETNDAKKPFEIVRAEYAKKQPLTTKAINFFKRIYTSPVFRNLITVAETLVKNPRQSTAIQGLKRLFVDVDFAEIKMNDISNKWANELNEIKSEIFGSIANTKRLRLQDGKLKIVPAKIGKTKIADWVLSQTQEVTKVIDGEAEVIELSNGYLLDVWLKAKDVGNLSGLELSGFNAEAIAEIDRKLPDAVKEYGERVMDFYRSKYDEINDVYRKMFYSDLPFNEFYSGRRSVSGVESMNNDLFSTIMAYGSVNPASIKKRRKHNRPILPSSVDGNLSQYIDEMSRFIAYAEVNRRLNKHLNDDKFKKAVVMNNGAEGGAILDFISQFQKLHIERINRPTASKVINYINKNVVVATLAGKLKNIPIQMLSFVNGQLSMPDNLTPMEWAQAHTNFIPDAIYLFENSKLLEQRGNNKTAVKAFTSVDDSYSYSQTLTSNDRTNMMLNTVREVADALQAAGMTPIRIGDMMGVMGSIPVFSAAKMKIQQENPTMSEADVIKEAMVVFESAVNRTQQPQTKGSRSFVQNNPYLRLLVNFGTTIILNINEAGIAARDLKRNANQFVASTQTTRQIARAFGVDAQKLAQSARPSRVARANIKAILNYGMLQPMMYGLYNASVAGGSYAVGKEALMLLKSLFDDEETEMKEFSEESRDILRVMLTGQFLDAPVIGSGTKMFFDMKILEKDFTFGSFSSVVILDEIDKFEQAMKRANDAKNPETKKRHERAAYKQMFAVLAGLPPKHTLELIQFWDELAYTGTGAFNDSEKRLFYEGFSFGQVDYIRRERTGVTINQIIERVEAEKQGEPLPEIRVKKERKKQVKKERK